MKRPQLIYIVILLLLPCLAMAQGSADSAKRVVLRKILINGNDRTRRQILLREMSLHEGDTLSADSLGHLAEKNRLRLYNLELFTEVSVNLVAVEAGVVDCKVAVRERWTIWPEFSFQLADRNFNVWWKEQNHDLHRANIGLTLSDRNFRGNMESMGATVQVGYNQKFWLDYYRPYFDKAQKQGIGVSFGLGRSQEMPYVTDSNKLLFVKDKDKFVNTQIDAAVVYTYRGVYATRHLLQLAYHDYEIADTVVNLNSDYNANGSRYLKMIELSYRFDYNGVDNWNYPLKGYKLVVYNSLRIGLEGMKFQAYSNVEAGMFRQPLPKWYLSVIYRSLISYPSGQPYALRTGLGTKTDYVRGYEYYVINADQYAVMRLDIKRELFNKTFRKIGFKYLPSVPFRVYPKLLADVGYAANPQPGNSFLNNKLLYSAGVGLDVVTAYDIKVRIEYVWNQLGQNGLFLHFNSE